MSVTFEIQRRERNAKGFTLSVSLCPGDEARVVDRVTVELLAPNRARLSPRLVLPLSGALNTSWVAQVELAPTAPVPPGAYFRAVMWMDGEAIEARCAAEEEVGLEAHALGRRVLVPEESDDFLESLTEEDRAALGALMPWLRADTSCASAASEPPHAWEE